MKFVLLVLFVTVVCILNTPNTREAIVLISSVLMVGEVIAFAIGLFILMQKIEANIQREKELKQASPNRSENVSYFSFDYPHGEYAKTMIEAYMRACETNDSEKMAEMQAFIQRYRK